MLTKSTQNRVISRRISRYSLLSLVLSSFMFADTQDDSKQPTTNTEAKNYKLQQVVTTARGTEQLLKDAPASITVISREELENKPHRDLAEAIADIPGVDVNTELGKTGGLKISIRGMPANYTLILIDGKRTSVAGDINTTNAGWSQADTSFMPPLSAIDRIEVIRGPMSTLYGSDAIGGVINIITKKSFDKYAVNIGLETTQNEDRQYGSGYMLNIFGVAPIIKDTLGLQLRARYYFREPSNVKYKYTITQEKPNTNTPPNFPNVGDVVTDSAGFIGNPTMAHIYDIGGRLLWNLDSNNHIYFDTSYASQWYDNSKEQLGQHTSTANAYIVSRNNNIIAHKGSYGSWSIENSLQFNQSNNDGRMTNTKPNNPRQIAGKDVILESKGFIDLPYENYLSVGAQYWFSWMQDMVAKPSQFSQHTFALFAENEWEAFDGFRFTLGLREDYNSRFGFNTSPKAYVVYEAIPDWLTLKGGVSMGYKAPYLNQLIDGQYGFGAQGQLAFLGNPNLKPETSLSFEMTALTDNDYFETGLTYFYSLFWDKISSETLATSADQAKCGSTSFSKGCSRAINVDRSYIQGVELYAGIKPLYGVNFDVSYTFTSSEQLTGNLKGSPLTDTLDHRFNAKLGYTWEDLHVYLRSEVQGNRFRGLRPGTDAVQQQVLGAYYKPFMLLHLGATYRINKNLKVNFAIYNLLDKDFADYRQYGWEQGKGGNSYTGNALVGNMYNYIAEGRRYWFSVNMDF